MRTKKILIILVCVLIPAWVYWADYRIGRRDINPLKTACEEEKLDAGYILAECYLGKDGGNNFIRLRVYSKNRELLAERFFMPYWESRGYGLAQDGKSIYYVIEAPNKLGYIQLPPTRLDWLRARLP